VNINVPYGVNLKRVTLQVSRYVGLRAKSRNARVYKHILLFISEALDAAELKIVVNIMKLPKYVSDHVHKNKYSV